jgi:peptidase C39-like protein
MPHIQTRIGGRRTSARFRVERPREGRTSHPISRVHQLDEHSCGFLAALMVIWYFDPTASTRDVLAALLPSPVRGCSQREVIRALSRFGIRARYRERLGWASLQGLARAGCPVIITIHPDEWLCDHWTVVRGLRDRSRRILLSNPAPRGYEYEGLAHDGSLSWSDFKGIWSPRGAGLVCESK